MILRCMLVLFTCASLIGCSRRPVNASYWDDLAIDGYDPVAYFTMKEAVQGLPAHTTSWSGANWRFATAEHLAMFEEDPEAYAPRYGGYCAWGVSQGTAADSDPNAWKIVDGKLYLMHSEAMRINWEEDIPGHITKADRHWQRLRQP